MANNPQARIGCKHAFDALGHHLRTIGHGDLPSMQRVTNAHTATIVNGNPRCPRGCVQHRIQQRPVSNCIAAVSHALGLAEWRSNGAAVEVIAPNHDRRLDLSLLDQIIHRESELSPLAVPEPADSGWQSLKLDLLLSKFNPAL